MYLYFGDWSTYLPSLDARKIPHGGRIIKTYTSLLDPREILTKPNLAIEEGDDSPFKIDEIFDYPQRKTYTGLELESDLASFTEDEYGRRIIRSLLRFAHHPDRAFVQYAMGMKFEEQWFIDHPFRDLHFPLSKEGQKSGTIHLDIFMPPSLENMRKVVDFDNPELLVTPRQTLELGKTNTRYAESQGLLRKTER